MNVQAFRFVITLGASLSLLGLASAQPKPSIKASMRHGGLLRTFSFYVPASYTPSRPTPLVFNLHGYTSNGEQQEFYGDFRPIADTAGFIVVHPDGSINTLTQQRFWNVGLFGGSNVDDVDFIHAIIDTLSSVYNIASDRIYSTGMSNGGFMSFHLACQSTRFAAVASVTGSMTTLTQSTCQTADGIPVMVIHGDADPIVPYQGSTGFLSIPNVLNFWVAKNKLDPSLKLQRKLPDIVTSDNAQAEYIYYPGKLPVAHIRVINGGHTWPGAVLNIGVTCQDFNASEVIWNFFNAHAKTTVNTHSPSVGRINIWPNPAQTELYILPSHEWKDGMKISVLGMDGRLYFEAFHVEAEDRLNIEHLREGVYFLQVQTQFGLYVTKFSVVRS